MLAPLALLAAGCGDEAVWARWRAEAALFHARKFEHRHIDQKSSPSEREFDRAQARYQAVVDAFPPGRWARPGVAHGPARQVAWATAEAGLAIGALEAERGRPDRALERWLEVERSCAALPGVVLRARLDRLAVLQRLRRFDEAVGVRALVTAMDPLGDPDREGPAPEVLEGPVVLAGELRELGRAGAADSLLAATDRRFAGILERTQGDDAEDLAVALSAVRAARRDAAGALAVLRARLAELPEWARADQYKLMASRALEAGAPESTIVYARRAAALSDTRRVAGQAWLLSALAWEQLGVPDSALASYDAVRLRWVDPGVLGPAMRFRRASLLERIGEWDSARGEFLALTARYPTDPLAFAAARRIVEHHFEHGEPELARIEGRTAIENIERLLMTNRDPVVQRHARQVRADLLLALGRTAEAEVALLDQWRRFPEDSSAQESALRAARLAEGRPGGAALADSIRAALRSGASSATVRIEAERSRRPEGHRAP
jgi:tetratricopeptide (TPR) repeat protein